MNGWSRISVRGVGGLGALAAAVALAGCGDLRRAVTLPPVNPESPVANIVGPASRMNYATPLLRDVPPSPRNIPGALAVKLGVAVLVGCRQAMSGYVLDHPPLTGGTAAFATDEREVAAVNPADIAPPDSAAKAEAYAADLRAEAAPPPAIASGPAPTAAEGKPPVGPAPPPPAAPRATASPRAPAAVPAPMAAPAPPPSSSASAAPPAGAVQANAIPPLPAALPDPLLARCT